MFKPNTKYRIKNVKTFIDSNPFYNKAIGEMFNHQGMEFVTLDVDSSGVNKIEFTNGFIAHEKGFKLHKSEVNSESIKNHHYIWLDHDEIGLFEEISRKDDLNVVVNKDNVEEVIKMLKEKFKL